MKLKFIDLLLASVLLVGSAQIFTSCKDNEADFYVNLKEETITLDQRLKDVETEIPKLKADLAQEIADRTAQDNALQTQITNQLAQISALEAQLAELGDPQSPTVTVITQEIKQNITVLQGEVQQAVQDLGTVKSDIQALQGAVANLYAIEAALQAAQGDITTIKNDITTINNNMSTMNGSILDILNRLAVLEGYDHDHSGILTRLAVVEAGLELVNGQINSLNTKIDNVEGQLPALNNFMNNWQSLLPEIQQKATDAYTKAVANKTEIDELRGLIQQLQENQGNTDPTLKPLIEAIQKQINEEILPKLDNFATLDDLANEVTKLENQAAENLTKAMNYSLELYNKLDERLTTVEGNINDLNNSVNDLNTSVNGLNTSVSALQTAVSSIESKLDDKANQTDLDNLATEVGVLSTDLQALQTLYDELKPLVDKNTADIKEINDALESINNRIEEVAGRINGIILQQTDNSVLGTLNLPVGINTMMLLGWWGEVKEASEFPTADPDYGYKGAAYNDYTYIGFSPADLARIGVSPEIVNPGITMERNADGKGKLGTVYMTVNPSNASLEGKTFSIVNSLGKSVPVELNPVPSNKELRFGYTRGGTDNGFYEAEALIDATPANIAKIQFQFDSNFKSTVAQIVNNGRKSLNAQTVAKLADALYDQLNGILPALAVSVSWNDSESGAMQVNSNYGLAVSALHARNLSFLNALDEKNYHLPNLPDLTEIVDRFDAWFDNIEEKVVIDLGVGNFNITFNDIVVKIKKPELVIDVKNPIITVPIDTEATVAEIKFTVEIEGEDHVGTATDVVVPIKGTASVNLNDFIDDLQASIDKALQTSIDQLADDFTSSINDQLKGVAEKISSKVGGIFESMQTNINSQIKDVLAYIQNSIDGKIEGFFNSRYGSILKRVENAIDRINYVLGEPSYYLQPLLLYNNGQKVGIISRSVNFPTVFNTSSNEAGVVIIPTTHCFETVVPLYKKFVAVTNVWKNGNVGGATQTDVLKAVNSVGYLNQVVPAERHSMALVLKKGYTYEITYQGLDYDGKVSGRKYYAVVK